MEVIPMMSVSEYASDVGKNVKDILNLCKKLENREVFSVFLHRTTP